MLSTSRKGARSELVACVWLIDQGYEVFRAVHPDATADLIVMRADVAIMIDIKSWVTGREGRPEYHDPLTKRQIAAGVRLLTVRPDTGECVLHGPGVGNAAIPRRLKVV